MLIFYDYSKVPQKQKLALAIGTFDGMHLGHQAVIKKLVSEAKIRNLKPAVLTFNPHPAVLAGKNPQLLQSCPHRLAQLENLGCEIAIVQNLLANSFNQLSPEKFVTDIIGKLGVTYVQVGRDFSFGINRSGSFADLDYLCRQHGIEAVELPTYTINGQNVSSSFIRMLLLNGDLELANQLLGYNYTLSGPVIHGAGRGHSIGFPTANIATDQLLPKAGVYGGSLHLAGKSYLAAVHIGAPATFGARVPTIEAYLPDYAGPAFYETFVDLELNVFIRDSLHFSSAEDLTKQMQKDLVKIKDLQ